MKPITGLSDHLKIGAFFILYFGLINTAAAQDIHYRDPHNPDLGYWQLFTNVTNQKTIIKFFNGHQQLLYEEIIKDRFIKLTDRNIKKINQSFDLVTGKSIIVTKVKSTSLTSADFKKLVSRNSFKRRNKAEESNIYKENNVTGLLVHAYPVENKPEFYLTVQNPQQERVFIYLFNRVNQNIYWEKIQKPTYHRKFSLEGLPQGQYSLVVSTSSKLFKYTQKIDLLPSTPLWQTEQLVPTILITNK